MNHRKQLFPCQVGSDRDSWSKHACRSIFEMLGHDETGYLRGLDGWNDTFEGFVPKAASGNTFRELLYPMTYVFPMLGEMFVLNPWNRCKVLRALTILAEGAVESKFDKVNVGDVIANVGDRRIDW